MTGLAQGAQAAGVLVEHRKAHGIQVLQDADGTFARHAQSLTQHARGGCATGIGDGGGDELTRMGLSGGRQATSRSTLTIERLSESSRKARVMVSRSSCNCSPTSGNVGASRPASSSKATIRSQASRTTRAAAAAECGSNTSAPSAAHTPREQPRQSEPRQRHHQRQATQHGQRRRA